jgi:hypothetical protein
LNFLNNKRHITAPTGYAALLPDFGISADFRTFNITDGGTTSSCKTLVVICIRLHPIVMDNLNHNDVIIKSVLTKKTLINTVYLWFFVTFVAACAFMPDAGQPYPIEEFIWFFIITSLIFGFVGYGKFLLRNNLTVTKESIFLLNEFTTTKTEYNLKDIIDYSWVSQPYNSSSKYGTVRLRKEFFKITFKNNDSIIIKGSDFKNYTEFQKFFYSFCKKNSISINGQDLHA